MSMYYLLNYKDCSYISIIELELDFDDLSLVVSLRTLFENTLNFHFLCAILI